MSICNTEQIESRWLSVKGAVAYSGIGKSRLYAAISQGLIVTSCLKEDGQARGTRLIKKSSLDEFIESRIDTINPQK